MPLKIGIVTEYYYPLLGGISENVHHTATELVARGHAVTIIDDAKIFTVIQVDGPYPNRGRSHMVRLYVEVQLPPDSGAVP